MYVSKVERKAHRCLIKLMVALQVHRPKDRFSFEDESDREDLNGSCRVKYRHTILEGQEAEVLCLHTENGDGWQTAVAYNFEELPHTFVGIEPKSVVESFRTAYAALSVMFCVSQRTGLIHMGTFFPDRFALTQSIHATLALQTLMPDDQFAQCLWQTIVRCGGPAVLQEIYEYHLDLIEMELRLKFPLEEIRLLS